MRILVHDYAGHPSPAELSRELARRGHEVGHAYFAGDIGPKGAVAPRETDPDRLAFLPVGAGLRYSKRNFVRRRAGDIAYGAVAAEALRRFEPDVTICGTTPTESVGAILRAARDVGSAFVYWLQDFNGLAARRLLNRKLPGLGAVVGGYHQRLDRAHLRASDHVVLITDAFRRETGKMGVSNRRISVIPNWGAINGIEPVPRPTSWAAEQGLPDAGVMLYSGTLALKHNPDFLVRLAEAAEARGDAVVSVVASGVGADFLLKRKLERRLPHLHLAPLQPFERFPEVLSSADVMLAVIEREAGEFSVPSKILSYLCAGRPIVLAAPRENLAARIVAENGAGMVVEPEDIDGFTEAALRFLDSPGDAGAAGRAYAEEHFQLHRVADRFEEVFERAVAARAAGLP